MHHHTYTIIFILLTIFNALSKGQYKNHKKELAKPSLLLLSPTSETQTDNNFGITEANPLSIYVGNRRCPTPEELVNGKCRFVFKGK